VPPGAGGAIAVKASPTTMRINVTLSFEEPGYLACYFLKFS
jgi:hypothetical protein